jgi:hypothetical protein
MPSQKAELLKIIELIGSLLTPVEACFSPKTTEICDISSVASGEPPRLSRRPALAGRPKIPGGIFYFSSSINPEPWSRHPSQTEVPATTSNGKHRPYLWFKDRGQAAVASSGKPGQMRTSQEDFRNEQIKPD